MNSKRMLEKIKEQLVIQNIDFIKLPKTDFHGINVRWMEKFTKGYKARHLKKFKWHIFSFNPGLAMEGENAVKEYKKQYPCDLYIFNKRFDYCLRVNKSATPDIKMDDFRDDIYIVHANYRWTYVISHEVNWMGPYFKKIVD